MIWSFCWQFWLIIISVANLLKLDFDCFNSAALSWVDDVTNGMLSFVSAFTNAAATGASKMTRFADQVRIRLVSQSFNVISKVF